MIAGSYRLITSINLDRHEILVVGGGSVGERKVQTLTGAGASVTLVSPVATEALRALAASGTIRWERRLAAAEDFRAGGFALLALPRDEALRLAVVARERGCLVDVCAEAGEGDFALCAQFERDGCRVGVSSGGGNPALAARVKRVLTRVGGERVLLSRGSPLALAQSREWQEALAREGVSARIETVTPHGDRDRERDLAAFGGFGTFVKALEEEMLAGRGDCAAHSLKDMPANLPDGCELSGVLPRASAFDALVTNGASPRSLDDLPEGARVGTSSARRRAQARHARPDLNCVPCRGNIGTRLEKLARGEFDALILAEAGLSRLGLNVPNAVRLPFVTAAGQGAVALETPVSSRGDAPATAARAANHLPTWLEVASERELLRLMGLGCSCPVGVNGVLRDGEMELTAAIYPPEQRDDAAPILEKAGGAVACEEDALRLARALWERLRTRPLLLELRAAAEIAPCL